PASRAGQADKNVSSREEVLVPAQALIQAAFKARGRSVETIITISGADKAGSLARIVSFLSHKGYRVKGQKIAELPSGSRLLSIRLGLALLDKNRLAAEIRALDADYT